MTRPSPRKSSLSGSSPVAPPSAETPEMKPARSAANTRNVEESGNSGKRKYPAKVSFYQAREDTDRVRGAIVHTMAAEGPRSLSQFINQAVMAEVERLERKYNGGRPFPPVGARRLPQGRPIGATTPPPAEK